MGFRTGAYAKVWETRPVSEKVTELRISVSRKNKDTGEFEQDFGGFVRCVGAKCAADAAALGEGASIKLGDIDVTRRWDKDAQKEYINYTVFSFDLDDGQPRDGAKVGTAAPKEQPKPAAKKKPVDDGEQDDELPF